MIDEYVQRVEQRFYGLNVRDAEKFDIYEQAKNVHFEKRAGVDGPDIDYGAERRLPPDGVARAPRDAAFFVRPHGAKRVRGDVVQSRNRCRAKEAAEVDSRFINGAAGCF